MAAALSCCYRQVMRIGAHDLHRFTNGQCHALAVMLHRRTGMRILGALSDQRTLWHVFVRAGDGRALDISGAHHWPAFVSGWSPWGDPGIVTLSEAQVLALPRTHRWKIPDLQAADALVDAVLGYLDGQPAMQIPGWHPPEGWRPRVAVVSR